MAKVEKIFTLAMLLLAVRAQIESLESLPLIQPVPIIGESRTLIADKQSKKRTKRKHKKLGTGRSLTLFPFQGQGLPVYNQFNMPGADINPSLYSSPFFPRYGSSSMIPPPPPIFHTGQLPIQSIYSLHYPTAFTPYSMYGLPHVYNPYFATNLPYSYLHHPYASQLMTQMGFMNQNMYNPQLSQQMTLPAPQMPIPGLNGPPNTQGSQPYLNPMNPLTNRKLNSFENEAEGAGKPDFKHLKINKKMIQDFLLAQEKRFANQLLGELKQAKSTPMNPTID